MKEYLKSKESPRITQINTDLLKEKYVQTGSNAINRKSRRTLRNLPPMGVRRTQPLASGGPPGANFLKKVGQKLLFSVLLLALAVFSFGKIDPGIFENMKARSIGPAGMSGRIGDIDAVFANPDIVYVGAATGGLWKSVNGGISWQPVFDDQPASSIGAVKIFQKNPNILWVGTGEGNPRNSSGVGRGVFKSLDGGKTWTCTGLKKTEKISRIVLHPHNPDIAYAAALGTTWGENPQRGVFKTTDGGKTWNKILYVDQKTGAADLVIDPKNPNKLIAAMWEHRRWPWFFKSGGPGSGIHITTDGGATWKKLTPKDGLPGGELGRTGLAFAHNKPEIVYALVEAKKSVLLRSSDGGFTWKTVNRGENISGRPFYYSDIRVNPVNENIIYFLQGPFKVSEDGGKTLNRLTRFFQVHPDYQALWLHPNGEHMIVGTDGGIAVSRDRGKNWRFVENLPVAQFYHISYDMEFPYNVYGGLQDNGSWRGPSRVLIDRSIFNFHWKLVGFGDGFDTEPDPGKSGCGYGMMQGGYLYYFNAATGLNKQIIPTESEVKHRYNWNAGFAIDPFDPATIYYGSQFVHRSKDRGGSWEIISPDLTSNDPEKQRQAKSGGLTLDVTTAENHTTIMCIAPSPVQKGVIWVGTDDGNVQLTTDGGGSWQLVSGSLTGSKTGRKSRVPFATWVPHVEASKFDAGEAFVVFDDHRRANWTPYVFVTRDFGRTWQSLSSGEIDGFVHVIEQDTVNRELLFLGAEFGLYVSFNGGKEWLKWNHGLPTVPVRDLAVHPRASDLIIGSHGRGVYIIDDISPLREIGEKLLQKELFLFAVQDTFQYRSGWTSSYISPGDAAYRGKNRPSGAAVTYWLKQEQDNKPDKRNKKKQADKKEKNVSEGKTGANEKTDDKKTAEKKLKVEVLNAKGEVIRRLRASAKKGLNRVFWNLCKRSFYQPEDDKSDFDWSGIFVLPGTYTVRVKYGDLEVKSPVRVLPDPRLKVAPAVLQENYKIQEEVGGWRQALDKAERKLKDTRSTLKTILARAEKMKKAEKEKKDALQKKTKELDKKLKDLLTQLNGDPDVQGMVDDQEVLNYRVFELDDLIFPIEPPSQALKVKLKKLKKEIDIFLKKYNQLFETDLTAYKKFLQDSGFSLFAPFSPLKLDNK